MLQPWLPVVIADCEGAGGSEPTASGRWPEGPSCQASYELPASDCSGSPASPGPERWPAEAASPAGEAAEPV